MGKWEILDIMVSWILSTGVELPMVCLLAVFSTVLRPFPCRVCGLRMCRLSTPSSTKTTIPHLPYRVSAPLLTKPQVLVLEVLGGLDGIRWVLLDVGYHVFHPSQWCNPPSCRVCSHPLGVFSHPPQVLSLFSLLPGVLPLLSLCSLSLIPSLHGSDTPLICTRARGQGYVGLIRVICAIC